MSKAKGIPEEAAKHKDMAGYQPWRMEVAKREVQAQDRRSRRERQVLDTGQPIIHASITLGTADQLSQAEIRNLQEAGK